MICDECETVAHCMKNGCVPKQSEKRLWFGLTDEEIKQLSDKHLDVGDGSYGTHYVFGETEFARAIEAKLKERNQ